MNKLSELFITLFVLGFLFYLVFYIVLDFPHPKWIEKEAQSIQKQLN